MYSLLYKIIFMELATAVYPIAIKYLKIKEEHS
jgi:hypothetical protein